MNDILEHLEANYPSLAAQLLTPFLDFMTKSREVSSDTDTILMMLVIAVRSYEEPSVRGSRLPQLLARDEAWPTLGTNIRSIAASLDIPRETVRRKVRDLIERGWVESRNGRLHVTPQAAHALTPLRGEFLRLALRWREVLATLDADR